MPSGTPLNGSGRTPSDNDQSLSTQDRSDRPTFRTLRERTHRDAVHAAGADVLQRRQIEGWVKVHRGAPPITISLFINDAEVATTFAKPATSVPEGLTDRARRLTGRGTTEVRRFRFALSHFWRYTKRTDSITVRAGGRPMSITTKGLSYHPRKDGSASLEELQEQLARGYTFSQSGKLQLSKTIDLTWQDEVFRLYDEVGDVMERELGHRPFVCYGTLLGAIREHDFIGHDRDFDSGYLSRQPDGPAAAAELVQLSVALIAAGFHVVPKYSCIAVKDARSGRAQIDIGLLFSGADGKVGFPFGIAGTTVVTPEQLGDVVETDFAGHRVLVPTGAEALLETIYGDSWRTPNSGFDWRRDRTLRNREGLLTEDQQDVIYWADFYVQTHDFAPSSFVETVLAQPDLPSTVVDLGCGDGRDTAALAARGRRVIGVDRSSAALNQARERTIAPDADVTFVECDLNDVDALASVIKDARGENPDGPVLFYARFLLHSLPVKMQQRLLNTLSTHGRPGDVFAAEQRTDQDKALPKTFHRRVRIFRPATTMINELEANGFTVTHRDEGTDLAPYLDEDPALLRVIARRNR